MLHFLRGFFFFTLLSDECVSFTLSLKDTCTRNINTAYVSKKLDGNYEKKFTVFFCFIARVMIEIDLCAEGNRNKNTFTSRNIFFLFHHQITINIYMCEGFPICGELFMWVLREIGEFTHACHRIVSRFSLLTMTKGNFLNDFCFKWHTKMIFNVTF